MRAYKAPFVFFLPAALLFMVYQGAHGTSPGPPPAPAVLSPDPQEDCPAEGIGGDPALNRQKNRTEASGAPREMTFQQMLDLNQKAVNKKGRENWTEAERGQVAEVESGGPVTATGYLYDAKYSEKETCNCSYTQKEWLDFHIWIVRNKRQAKKSKSFVVEITPRVRREHPGWTVKKLRALILPRKWALVRVEGLLTFDSEHWNFVRDKKRATMWEIHPVTKFWVCSRGSACDAGQEDGWKSLDED